MPIRSPTPPVKGTTAKCQPVARPQGPVAMCDLGHPGRVCDLGRPRASRSPVCIAVACATAMRAKSGLGGEPAQSTLPFSPLFQPLLRPFPFPSPLPFLPLAPLSPCKDHWPLNARWPSPPHGMFPRFEDQAIGVATDASSNGCNSI